METIERKTVGHYFKVLADQQSIRQRDIAKKLGVERSTISKLYGGVIKADDSYARMAEFFGLTLEQAVDAAEALAKVLNPQLLSGEEEVAEEEESAGYVIAIASEKGGVGKTSLSVNLAMALAQQGKQVLLVDMDPQGNATEHLGVESDGEVLTNLLRGLSGLEDLSVVETDYGFDLLAGGRAVATARADMLVSGTGISKTDQIIDPLRDIYDVVLIDTPPEAGILQQSALVAADGVLAPVILEKFAIDGLENLLATIDQVRHYNEDLDYIGCVVTNLDTRKTSQRKIMLHLERHEDASLFSRHIRTDAKMGEAQLAESPVLHYAPKSKSSKDYHKLAEAIQEVIDG